MTNVSDIKTVLPVNTSGALLRVGQNSIEASVSGVLSTYASILDYEAEVGQFFSLADNMASRQVVVLGSDVAEELFPDGNAVGEYVSIFRNQAKSYQVVGVMQEKDASFNLQFNGTVYIPYNTYTQRFIKPSIVGSYVVRVADGADALAVSDAITEFLDRTVGSDAYRLFSPASLADMALADYRNLQFLPCCYCRDFSAGWRDWHYEHYAGFCGGADARDRYSKSSGSFSLDDYGTVHH